MRPALLVALAAALLPPAAAEASRPGCTVVPPRATYDASSTPGPGLRPAVWSAHRGGVDLGPQQTIEAYRGAIAYGADNLEVDLRMSSDGVFVVAHDAAPRSVGVATPKPVTEQTAAEYTSLNAAIGPWTGTDQDPARYVTFEQVLQLAKAHKTGLDIEFKDIGVRRDRIREVAQAVEDAGIMDRTIWQHGAELDIVADVLSVDRNARFNNNINAEDSPYQLYALAATTEYSFGSTLAEFTPDKVAAIHDGCGLVLPHSYDGLNDNDPSAKETAKELAQMRAGLARGVDGFQTNRPDAMAEALGEPVPSRLVRSDDGWCLVNADNGLPLAHRTVQAAGRDWVTGKGGCVPTKARVRFDGDGAARAPR